jgi:CDP-diacylglycerol--glycerol-3-phosphate 3-phosphatidyltransferase
MMSTQPKRRRPGFRRQFGIDRSGPNPEQTRPGEPLRPWTLPNLIGYIRLAALPVFCILAFDSGDGHDATASILYWFIAAGDYFDGFVARATGQYSRMGAILDPIVDRLTVLAGVAVCWHFDLLPHWALVVLVVREIVTAVLAEMALRNRLELEINWLGRIAIFNVMSAIFFAMAFGGLAWHILLYIGLAAGILSTVMYARSGLAHYRQRANTPA